MRIDELRVALEDQADRAADEGVHPVVRTRAVHARVSRIRRRRTAAVGTALAAVVAIAAVVVAPQLRHAPPQPVDQPAPRALAGHTVPTRMTAVGYEYAYTRGIESAPGARRL